MINTIFIGLLIVVTFIVVIRLVELLIGIGPKYFKYEEIEPLLKTYFTVVDAILAIIIVLLFCWVIGIGTQYLT